MTACLSLILESRSAAAKRLKSRVIGKFPNLGTRAEATQVTCNPFGGPFPSVPLSREPTLWTVALSGRITELASSFPCALPRCPNQHDFVEEPQKGSQ
jgi:hypothetical protein